MPTIDEPGWHRGRDDPRQREQGARVRVQRPVPVLVLGLERGADDACRGVVDEDVERPERRDLLLDPRRRDVPADEDRLGAERAELVCGLLGGGVRAEVADRHGRRALARQAQRDRLPDPARPSGDEDAAAGRAHRSPRGSGSDAVADDGIVSQPIRSRDSGSAFSDFVEANPSRSSSSIFSSP